MMKEQLQSLMKQYFTTKDVRRTLSLIKPFLLKQWKAYLVLLVLLAVDIFLTIAFAKFYGEMTDSAMQGGYRQILSLIPYGAFLILLSITTYVMHIYFDTMATNGVKKDLENHLFAHILRLPAGDVSNLRSGELMAHFSNDIHGVDGVIGSSLIGLIRLPIVYIAVFVYLLHINMTLCFVSISIAPIIALSGLLFGVFLRKNGRKIHQLTGEISHLLHEAFNGFAVIRSFTLEKMIYSKYERKNRELLQLELDNAKLRGWYYSGGQIVGSLTFIASLSVGSLFVSKHLLPVGSLFTFINLVHYLVNPLTGLAGQWAGFQRSAAGLERVLTILEKPLDSKELPAFLPLMHQVNSSIELRDVTFGYEKNKPVLQNVHLMIPAGKVTALVGESGAGKSTLFNLIQGLYHPQDGEILIDGKLNQSFSRSELRSFFAHVPQETFLFSGTVRENLMIARPNITEKDMTEAAINAEIHDFILSLPNGFDTEIGENGIKLSGGQKQRLAIARAILKDAPILLLDEATSALDGETEYHVKAALDKLMEGRTTIVIAHRLSTIQNADVIMVMDKGKIVQIGNHESLMNQPGYYRNLNDASYKRLSLVP